MTFSSATAGSYADPSSLLSTTATNGGGGKKIIATGGVDHKRTQLGIVSKALDHNDFTQEGS